MRDEGEQAIKVAVPAIKALRGAHVTLSQPSCTHRRNCRIPEIGLMTCARSTSTNWLLISAKGHEGTLLVPSPSWSPPTLSTVSSPTNCCEPSPLTRARRSVWASRACLVRVNPRSSTPWASNSSKSANTRWLCSPSTPAPPAPEAPFSATAPAWASSRRSTTPSSALHRRPGTLAAWRAQPASPCWCSRRQATTSCSSRA